MGTEVQYALSSGVQTHEDLWRSDLLRQKNFHPAGKRSEWALEERVTGLLEQRAERTGMTGESADGLGFGVLFFVCLFVFQDRVSLYSPDCPGTHSVDQASLELRNLASKCWD